MSEVLYNSIRNWLSYSENRQIDISRKTGISKQLIHLVIEKKGKKDLVFSKVLSIIRALEDDYLDTMDTYCRTLDKPQGILNALEYAWNFKRSDLMDDLIADYADHRGEIKEWVAIYKLIRDIKLFSKNEALGKCKELYGKVNQIEAKMKLDLIETDLKFSDNLYNLSGVIDGLDDKMKDLRDGFLKDSMTIRCYLYRAFVTLYEMDNPVEAREAAKKVVDSWITPPALIASAHHLLGHSYMYDSCDKAMFHLHEARKYYEEAGDIRHEHIMEDEYFVQNINKQIISLDLLQGEELAHQLIVRGECDKACEVLDKIDNQSPYYYLFCGMAKGDVESILSGYGQMRSTGNLFFSLQFKNELSKMYQLKEVRQ